MKSTLSPVSFAAILLILGSLVFVAQADTVQYCHNGDHEDASTFCMAIATYHNHSSSSHDLYITVQVTKPSPLGWTAFGIGSHMAGALMLILHGDPASDRAPSLNLRTASGHHQPRPIKVSESPGLEVRTQQLKWLSTEEDTADTTSSTAVATIVCYSCTLWSGTSISTSSTSQQWIWARNHEQDMDEASEASELVLEKHDRHGTFFVDMARSVSHGHHDDDAFLPVPDTSLGMVGTSETPDKGRKDGFFAQIAKRPLAHLHGLLMGMSFLFLFPLGAVAIRFRTSGAFKYHWVVQATGMVCALGGAVTALIMTGGDVTGSAHQVFGLTLVSLLFLQALLGWRHHITFLRVRHRTWISHGHIWLGRMILLGGWGNVLSGLILYGLGGLGVGLVVMLIFVEAIGVGTWSFIAERRRTKKQQGEAEELLALERKAMNTYFAVEDSEDDAEDEDERERNRSSES